MKRLRCSLLMVLAGFFLLTAGPVPAADFGFGIPDMVEEKVDELDEKVRNYKARQPVFDEFRNATVAVSEDTRDVAVSSTVAEGSFNNRIFIMLDVNRPGQEGLVIFQSDGEGKPISSEELATSNDSGDPEFAQMSVSPTDEFVDILMNIPTDSGPQGLLMRRQTDNNLNSVGSDFGPIGAGPSEIVIGNTADTLGQTDTAAEVNTFSYDDVENDLYFSGDSGVFKVFTGPSGALGPSNWDAKFQGEFEVPEDNLLVNGDTVFVTTLEPAGGVDRDILIRKISAGGTITDTASTPFPITVSDPQTSLIGGEDRLFFHYYEPGSSDDHIYRLSYDDLSVEASESINFSSHFRLKIEGSQNLFAEGNGGKIYSFDKNSLTTNKELTVSDTRATVAFQDQARQVYVGTKESAEASVIRVQPDLTSGDTTQVFPSTGQVFEEECQQEPAELESVFTRPVWLKQGFLGILFNGACVTWNDENINSEQINTSSGWPHEDANNQRQRERQQ